MEKVPKIYVFDAPFANVVAFGHRDDQAIAVTTKTFEVLSADEMEAILAHQIAYLRYFT
jgi:Zn-dependent protease with chaperone function